MHRTKTDNSTQNIYDASQTIAQVKAYLDRGFAPIPVEYQQKAPNLKNWPNATLCQKDLPEHFGSPHNIGVVLGAKSNGLLDVDIDDADALKVAGYFLPATGMIFGRASRPRSHWLYRCPITKSKKFTSETSSVIVEMRGDGAQTVFPGSVHKSGELISFDTDSDPALVEYDQLVLACAQICIAKTLLGHWVQSTRHDLSMAVAGR